METEVTRNNIAMLSFLHSKKFSFIAGVLMLILVGTDAMFGQKDKTALQRRKVKIEREIRYTNQLLNETKKSKQSNLNQLYLINKKINRREALIQEIGTEVTGIDNEVVRLNDTIDKLSVTLAGFKKEYAELIYNTYKNHNAYDRLMFIFASKDFNQAYRRLKYMQQYTDYRKKQAAKIQETQLLLWNKKSQYEKQKSSKLLLIHNQQMEKQQLTIEQDEKNLTIKSLTKQEKNLARKLQENQAALRKLQAAIEAVVAEEVRKAKAENARKAAAEAAKSTVKTGTKTASKPAAGTKKITPPVSAPPIMSTTTEEISLSKDFAGNRGKLPWPVDRGVIAVSYGEHAHPEFKNIKIRNNGIDIVTTAESRAKAVFPGVVSSVISIVNLNYVVIIRHGDYLTVYSNLKSISVKKGDKVKIKQDLGSIFTDPEENKTMLHFELWHGTSVQNPESWLSK
ncbi:MAG TPA: peptidoglycan DD-metalloendopeptidase family protein [Bacteroidales bacterium]|nr:peptidoglycan DD-metalloendopeptidase family protein [Bacteroidales bacterium]HPT01251.1 peptidoglycan DD-metalloendopeptidase family protein [Bacteroidales bacterium]